METHCERWHSRLLARQFGFFGQSAFEPSYRPDRFRAVWAWPSLLPSVGIWFVLRISAPLCGTQKKNSPLKNHDIISEKSPSTILPIWNERVQRPMATTHISGVLINVPFKLYPVYQCEQDPILFVTREKMAQPAFGGNGRHVAQKSPAESATSKQSRMLSIPFYLYSIRTVVRKNSKKWRIRCHSFSVKKTIPALSQQKSLDLHFRSSLAQVHWVVWDRKTTTITTTFQ